MIRRPPIETKVNHERWLVSYSDFITLLFAFFVVMYSVSHVNEQKYRQLSSTLDSAFSSGSSPVEDEAVIDQENTETPNVAEVNDLADNLKEALAGLVDESKITMSGNEQWVEIELDANLLFQSGSAKVSEPARQLLSPVANILEPYDNAVAIAGHTDDVPISNVQFPNNWALSSARAVSVVNYLAYQGVKPQRLSAVGYGEYQPVVENSNDENRARNRRVVIKVAKNAVVSIREPLDTLQSDEGPNQASEASKGEESNGDVTQEDNDGNTRQQATDLSRAESSIVEAPAVSLEPEIDPVRLQGGGLLFSSDPGLPRSNPPVIISDSPVIEPAAESQSSP